MKIEKLKSIVIDTEKGIFEVNGKDISGSSSHLRLEFEGAIGTLEVEEHRLYTTRADSATTSISDKVKQDRR